MILFSLYAQKLKKMSKLKQNIHEFDLKVIYEYFSNVERQGPGSPEITIKALGFIEGLTAKSKVADIGCGTGGSTIILAQNIPCKVTGIELWPDYIMQFKQNAQNKNLQHKMTGKVGNMKNLPFREEELDLIWSEGAIYNIGFKRGLKEWRKFLKQDGYLAVTENTWFTDERPSEISEFWQKAYPEIDTIPNKLAQMQEAGYLPVATFVVPESCWTSYYSAMQKKQKLLLDKNKNNKAVEEFIDYQRYEAELYYKYKAYYGYAFYIGKKINVAYQP